MPTEPSQHTEKVISNRRHGLNAETLQALAALATRLGAGETAVIAAGQIVVEPELAQFCKAPGCSQYGLSKSCPPHVAGPAAFERWRDDYRSAMVVKIEVPSEVLLSSERVGLFELLHQIVAGVETAAVSLGYRRARAFAGGSCKQIFCDQHPDCRVVDHKKPCRNPQYARPSMSGFGINVGRLMQSAGWQMDKITRDTDPQQVPLGTLVGLILID